MTRQIVLDTETTGLYPSQGDRIIEIGAIELIDGKQTGIQFHTYLNPEGRETSAQAYRINGLDYSMLSDQPRFSDIVNPFIKFIRGSVLIMHNSSFDLAFLDRELSICNAPLTVMLCRAAICTKKMSEGLSLDDLCLKYKIDTSHRKTHGALIDAELLAKCWVAMNNEDKGPQLLRSSVMNTIERFITKYAACPEGKLIHEIKDELESLA